MCRKEKEKEQKKEISLDTVDLKEVFLNYFKNFELHHLQEIQLWNALNNFLFLASSFFFF